MQIVLNNIAKKYEGNANYTLENINFKINSGEFVVLLGPSGSGKTTLLRMIAGLISITKGDLFFGSKRVNNILPKERDIAMVFQSYALYPTMDVFNNIAFSLKMSKVPKAIMHRKVIDVAKILGIEQILYKKPSEISGGQRQRVALGRAIVRKPSIFLMDEPLSNLDAKLRDTMRNEIKRIHKFLNTTSIYVTHDQHEAMSLADRILVINDNEIQQIGTPDELYFKPSNLFVAKFIGNPENNFIDGEVKKGFFISKYLKQKIKVNSSFEGKAIISIRPEDILISKNPKNADINLKILDIKRIGNTIEYLAMGNEGKQFQFTSSRNIAKEIKEGVEYDFCLKNILLFDKEKGVLLK